MADRCRILKFGGELIYEGYTTEPPYRFTAANAACILVLRVILWALSGILDVSEFGEPVSGSELQHSG